MMYRQIENAPRDQAQRHMKQPRNHNDPRENLQRENNLLHIIGIHQHQRWRPADALRRKN